MTDCGADGDPLSARIRHFGNVIPVDATNCEPRQLDFCGDLPDKMKAGKLCKRFCIARKCRTDAKIIGAVKDSLSGLLDRVGRDTDQPIRTDDASRILNRELVLSEMHSVRLNDRRDVGPVVNDEKCSGGRRPFSQCSGARNPFPISQ